MERREFVILAEFTSSIEAELARTLLASAGINAEIDNEFMSTLYPPAIPCRLMVSEEDLEQAKGILFQR
jgi:hypothetical protein